MALSCQHGLGQVKKIDRATTPSAGTSDSQPDDKDAASDKATQEKVSPDTKPEPRRQRIIDRQQIKNESSLPSRIALAPFRFLAPRINAGLTRVENERLMNRLELVLSNPSIRPMFGSLGDGSGFGAGVYLSTADRLSRNYKLFLSTHGTLNSYLETMGGVEVSPSDFAGGRLRLDLVGRYRYRPEEDFWGVGIDSSRAERTTYTLTERGIRTQASVRIAGPLRIGALLDYSSNTVTAGEDKRFPTTGELFGAAALPGLQSGAALLGAGLFAEFDRRDMAANPHRGFYGRFAATSNDSVGRDDFGFINYALDARGYVPLGSTRRTLAVRVLADFNDPRGGSQVPFFRLARLGDTETLRGYDTYRFHARHGLHASVEYRYQLASTFDEKGFGGVDALAFTDIGQVFNHRSEFSMNNLRATWGGGIQFSSARSTVFRVLYARSPEGARLFFSFGPSF
ncbi:MAG TPA: BamA/TamA family outer membrane protein [Pyrinomonadaceae bacterium]|nr:BamA/TamA family outer membrane protein [Pyrinomonadaceae bacterium]